MMTLPDSQIVRYRLGRRLALVAGLFVLLVAIVMASNVYLLRTADPLHAPALAMLLEQLEGDVQNETLRQQIRELDLLARRAFLVRQWQIETGVWLLVGGLAVWALGLQLMTVGRKRLPDLNACPGLDDPWTAAKRARHVMATGGLLLLSFTIAVAWRLGHQRQLPETLGLLPLSTTQPVAVASAPDVQAVPVAVDPADAVEGVAGWAPAFRRYWPAFRGLGGLGVAAADADPPVAWDGRTGSGVRWKVPVPLPGFSSPVVWGSDVFLTGADADRQAVYAFDAGTGELRWTADAGDVPGAPVSPPAVTDDTGYAAPSVATDGKRVVAIFGTGTILCLDNDGRRLWARNLGVPDNHYGHASSLLIGAGRVFVQYDHFGGSKVLALDLETGRSHWTTRRTADISWASPILIETGSRLLLILNATPMVSAYDALTGEQRWANVSLSGEIGASPAYAAGRVFAANAYARAIAMDAVSGETLWENTRLELPDAGSPLATADALFLPTSYGTFSCVDAADGRLLWEHDFDAGGYGSPVMAAGRVYWITEDGVTRIFKASTSFELIAEPPLGESSMCTPALVGRRLYIRGDDHLFCIGPE